MCHDLLRHYNRKTSPRCLTKIDLRKAYDMVQWEFIKEMLVGYGFPPKFYILIMACIVITSFSLKVNEEGQGFLEGKRGLREGSPISPLLFVLVMEYLSRVLSMMSNLPDFRYNPLCKELKLTHLVLGNDLMIFFKGQEASVRRIVEALTRFSITTLLSVNTDKSSLYTAGVTDEVKKAILACTGFTVGSFPMRYLGLPYLLRNGTNLIAISCA